MRKKELQAKYDEIESLVKESPSLASYIKDLELIDAIRTMITDRRQWIDYALTNEVVASRYKHAIIHALSIPEREWTKDKISIILKKALGEL